MTFLISTVPVLELRAAIPFGTANGLPLWTAALVSVLGNIAPVPFLILFIRRIFTWLRQKSIKWDRLIRRLELHAAGKGAVVRKYQLLGLFILVAIPLPGTGAWTGALVAAMLDIRLRQAFPVIAAGVIAAGGLVSLLTAGVISLT